MYANIVKKTIENYEMRYKMKEIVTKAGLDHPRLSINIINCVRFPHLI